MRKSTILFLLTSVFASLSVSCGSNPVKGLTQTDVENQVFDSPYFSDPKTDYVYKTNISVYGNELSGIFIAKRIGEHKHRVVFTTEFGNKLLDFEISEQDYKVNAIVEELDRKMLVKTLVQDFRLLLRERYLIEKQFETGDYKVLQAKDGGNLNYLYVSKADGKLAEIKHSSKRKEKISITFSSENNIFAEKILIQHSDIQLKIVFHYFKNQ